METTHVEQSPIHCLVGQKMHERRRRLSHTQNHRRAAPPIGPPRSTLLPNPTENGEEEGENRSLPHSQDPQEDTTVGGGLEKIGISL